MLLDWAGPRIVKDAESLIKNGRILKAEFDAPRIHGSIACNNRALKTALIISESGEVESECPCRDNKERGIICAHVVALGLVLIERATDSSREAKYVEQQRRMIRASEVKDEDFIRRGNPDTPGVVAATIRLTLEDGWEQDCTRGRVKVFCSAEYENGLHPLDEVPRDLPLLLDKRHESVLFVLEDIAQGPTPGTMEVGSVDLINIIGLHAGRTLYCENGSEIVVQRSRVTTFLRLDMNSETGDLVVTAHTELPFVKPGDTITYIVFGGSGWVHGAGNMWELEHVLPEPYHSVYRGPVQVDRDDVIRFLRQEIPALSAHLRIESDISIDLFTIDSAEPEFRLLVKGSPASLAAVLFARYGKTELVAGKPDAREHFAVPDPEDLMRYMVRNEAREKQALELLANLGLVGSCGDELGSIVGEREVLNLLGSGIPFLKRRGWKIDMEGRVSPFMESLPFATPVVRVRDSGGAGWFDIGFEFEECSGASISHADIQRALRMGDSYVKLGDRSVLIDSDAVESMTNVFSDCASADASLPGYFRLSNLYAPFVQSSLDALDGIDVECDSDWRKRTELVNRNTKFEPVKLSARMDGLLRTYQKEGVHWLQFLEQSGFGGILADEMGLGKTVQTLAWLELQRLSEDAAGKPALIVCPTSLVDNWAEEAAKFAPDMKVLTLSGPDRHEKWDEIEKTDAVITSYALLKRDIDRHVKNEYSAVVLDEAQHIKNRSTANAVAAKQIRGVNRFVLTGTPIENSVADLWSIMDFLMPGYLGGEESFRQTYALPIARGGDEADAAQAKLRRKIHPFLLRRLKQEVATDLPPKIQKVSFCALTPDQRAVYGQLLKASRERLGSLVASRGYGKCRMEVLSTLMRLRQACCHLGLLKLPGLEPEAPSAKMDLFFEFLDEALDGGHRILVFSQFVQMLHILRDAITLRGLEYCYLDGSTKERVSVVHKFNTERNIPLFLISLKAGGTGLNLTGADMVIHFDPWWNPAVEDQATDRAHRIGQKKTVYSIKLMTRDTVEEKVLALQEKKRSLINATIESDNSVMEKMTWEDVDYLLSD
jgi:superfamily II DNA or RNA helicase